MEKKTAAANFLQEKSKESFSNKKNQYMQQQPQFVEPTVPLPSILSVQTAQNNSFSLQMTPSEFIESNGGRGVGLDQFPFGDLGTPGFNLPTVEHSDSAISTENNGNGILQTTSNGQEMMDGLFRFNSLPPVQQQQQQRVLNNNIPAEKAVRKSNNKEEEKKHREIIDDVNRCTNCEKYDFVEKDGNLTCQSCGAIADKIFQTALFTKDGDGGVTKRQEININNNYGMQTMTRGGTKQAQLAQHSFANAASDSNLAAEQARVNKRKVELHYTLQKLSIKQIQVREKAENLIEIIEKHLHTDRTLKIKGNKAAKIAAIISIACGATQFTKTYIDIYKPLEDDGVTEHLFSQNLKKIKTALKVYSMKEQCSQQVKQNIQEFISKQPNQPKPIAIKALNKLMESLNIPYKPVFDQEIQKIVDNSNNNEVINMTKRAPHTQAAFIVYLINQLSLKFKDDQRVTADQVSEVCQLNVATLKELYLEVKKADEIAKLVEGVNKFRDLSQLKKP